MTEHSHHTTNTVAPNDATGETKQRMRDSVLRFRPLPCPASIEDELASQPARVLRTLTGTWRHVGRGSVICSEDGTVNLGGPARYDTYPHDWPQDGDYVGFGQTDAVLDLDYENWTEATHLRLTINSNCTNLVNAALTLLLTNDGAIKLPDEYQREGQHVFDLAAGTRDYVLDIASTPRDAVTSLTLSFTANGSYLDAPGTWDVTVERVVLESRDEVEPCRGWQPAAQRFSYSQLGYHTRSTKTAVAHPCHIGESFSLRRQSDNTIVYEGALAASETPNGAFAVADFSSISAEGIYELCAPGMEPAVIRIGSFGRLLGQTQYLSLNFVFCERCGHPVPGIHGTCHADVFAEHNGVRIPYTGGWHDAGDLSQQTVQTAEVALGLAEAASAAEKADATFAERLWDEALWGVDFVLRMRLGNGYRASSAGVSRWTNGRIGDMDDAYARVHNSPYDNFLITGILARIATLLPADNTLATAIRSLLSTDYEDAVTGFEQAPFKHDPIFWEHTYSTSKSLYIATMIWCAAQMHAALGDERYLTDMDRWVPALVDCQERDGIACNNGSVLRGMFYRDETHRVFQHFNHQAREHLYAQALASVIAAHQGSGATAATAHEALEAYGSYLLAMMTYCAPYPLIASGVYRTDENSDDESFQRQHLLVDERARDEFGQQMEQGIQLAPGYVAKRFPAWFSFRGNEGVVLSQALAAAEAGYALGASDLIDIAFKQMQWTLGFNPFSQSLMVGAGDRFPHLYSVSSGQIAGSLPVGIETADNEDIPYWPSFNNATYKEVWVGLAGKWLNVAATIIRFEEEQHVE